MGIAREPKAIQTMPHDASPTGGKSAAGESR